MQLFAKRKFTPPVKRDPSLRDLYNKNLDHLHDADRELADAGLEVARYRDCHKDLRISTIDGQTAIQVNAMTADSELARLESVRDHCRNRFHQLLAEHSELKMRLGLCR